MTQESGIVSDFLKKTTATTFYGAGSQATKDIFTTATKTFASAWLSIKSLSFIPSWTGMTTTAMMPFRNPSAALTGLKDRSVNALNFVKDQHISTARNAWDNFKRTAPFILAANVVYQITGQIEAIKESTALRVITSLALTTLGAATVYTIIGSDVGFLSELMKATHLAADVTASALMWKMLLPLVSKTADFLSLEKRICCEVSALVKNKS